MAGTQPPARAARRIKVDISRREHARLSWWAKKLAADKDRTVTFTEALADLLDRAGVPAGDTEANHG